MKRAIKSLIFCVSVLLLVLMCAEILRPDNRRTITAFRQLPKNSIDFMTIGSSYGFCTISPLTLWGQSGIAAYDLGENGLRSAGEQAYLSYALRYQSPKVIALEVTCLLLENRVPNWGIVQLMSLPFSLDKVCAARETTDESEFINLLLFPLGAVHSQWNTFTRGNAKRLFRSEYKETLRIRGERGHRVSQLVEKLDQTALSAADRRILAANIPTLYDMIQLAEDHGCKIVLFCGPNSTPKSQALLYEIQQELQAEFPSLRYVDLGEAINDATLDVKKDFINSSHLNAVGAVKATKWFNEEVLADYHLSDHREEKAYFFWHKDRKYFLEKIPQTYSDLAQP